MNVLDKLQILILIFMMMPITAILILQIVEIIWEIRDRRYEKKQNKMIGTKEWYENR